MGGHPPGVGDMKNPSNEEIKVNNLFRINGNSKPLLNSESSQKIELYSTNPDIIFSSEYPAPRFAGGSFVLCLKTLFKEITGKELNISINILYCSTIWQTYTRDVQVCRKNADKLK